MLLDEKAQKAEDEYISNLNRLGLHFDIYVSRDFKDD